MAQAAACLLVVLGCLACGAGSGDSQAALDERALGRRRQAMVETQIRDRGVADPRVLAAMTKVPRHLFVRESDIAAAYEDHPLDIGFGQTISQPYIVAFMTEALDVGPEHKVLEIGTGSGYQAAVLAELARDVYTIEIVEPLAERSRALLQELGYRNVHVRAGNGYLGWPEAAPFDRIIVTAAPDEMPPALVEQLKMDGLIAVPVGVGEQMLQVMRRTPAGLTMIKTLPVRFVPMTGKPKT
jgi:protein-L-isoaspartate(D-aspartate) O-methyltransferase